MPGSTRQQDKRSTFLSAPSFDVQTLAPKISSGPPTLKHCVCKVQAQRASPRVGDLVQRVRLFSSTVCDRGTDAGSSYMTPVH